MSQSKLKNNIVYYLFCLFTGIVIAVIVWVFLFIMNFGIEIIWDKIPTKLEFKFYPIVVCTIGGLILGIHEKITNAIPDELDGVMEKVRNDKFYPYNKVLFLCISALMALVFGGSIGPEAGLTGVIVGLCYWAGSHMKSAKIKIPELMEIGISSTLGIVFCAPLFGLMSINEEKVDLDGNNNTIKASNKISNIIAVLGAFGAFFILRSIFGGSSGLPRIGDYNITNSERLWGIPLSLLGGLFGLFFVFFEKITHFFFEKIQRKFTIIASTVLGGFILGVIGTYFPLVMFSGEESINELSETYMGYAPWLLIVIGILKLFMTSACIKSGWRGGHFFPVIFCGISIGYGIAMLTGLDISFCLAVITAGILGTTMKKPLAVTLLLLLCFDIRIAPWLVLAAFVGSLLPTEKRKVKNEEK